MNRAPHRRVAWVAGLILMANLYLLPTVPASPRATDVGGIALAGWVLWRVVRGRQAVGPLALLAFAALWPLGWLVMSLFDGDAATTSQAARWLVAVPWAAALSALLTDQDCRRSFAWGLVWGGAVNVAVVLLQAMGFEGALQIVGLSTSDSAYYHYVGQMVRIPGLHGQHNASSTVVSLVVPATLYLYFRHRCPLAVPLGALAGFLVVLHLTSTRSPLVVAILTVGYAFVAARAFGRGFVIATVLLAVAVPLVVAYGPPGGWSRWRDAQAINVNADERLASTVNAAALSLDHPLGLGVTRGKEALYDRSGIRATHNAFLQAAVYLGLPLGLLILVSSITVTIRSLSAGSGPLFLPGLLAFHTAGVFMFEEHLNNPTFVILAAWFLVVAVARPPRDPGSALRG
ncbi:MAG TPA: hypothetical protein PLL30_12570 [Candidatus Krumholzibacteria bacterium]|nr:hypothetical protein [Candidatus Krumholzibacteria bacterium]HPD72602.1 hypothetical protein [Candidatus Krumholzibacteria bacterium]HRY40466.1 hypothetical protein [Candidatus Krumholzibacteria bacterium]